MSDLAVFNPRDWYWEAADGRIYSSARASLVSPDDAGLRGFLEAGGIVTAWPRDAAGEETDAELNAVLAQHDLSMAGPLAPKMTFLEFMDLFTGAEQLAIAGAAMTEAAIKLWYDRALGASYIAIDDARLAAGLQTLVDADLITSARRARVLAGLPPVTSNTNGTN